MNSGSAGKWFTKNRYVGSGLTGVILSYSFGVSLCVLCIGFLPPGNCCASFATGLLLFWHASLGVRSTICRYQPPQRTVLGQVECFIQCEVVGSQVALDSI